MRLVHWDITGTVEDDLLEGQEELLELRQSVLNLFLQTHKHVIEF